MEILYGTLSFESVMELHGDTVKRIALLRLRNSADAKDVFQDVFLKLYKCRKKFSSQEEIRAWLIRVTIHACIDEERKFWKRRRTQLEDVFAAESKKEERLLLEYLMELSSSQRNALYLYYYEGYSVKEIAELMKAKENTVKSWMKRGREELKRMLGGEAL